jgi:cobalt-zinc-cadmium efflux system outer membrane protein
MYLQRFGLSKIPIVNRFLIAILVLCAFSRTAFAEETANAHLAEADVVRRTLDRAPVNEAIAGTIEMQRGLGLTVGAYPNPVIAYWREQTYGTLGTGEDYASLSQLIDLGNRRGLRADAGAERARAAAYEGDASRLRLAAEARLRFAEVLHRELRSTALRRWIERIAGALQVVAKRTARGDAAVYDRRRLEREQTLATARVEVEEAASDRARARLNAVIGAPADARLDLSGNLLPEADPQSVASLRSRAERRPDLLALDAGSRASELERKSASRWWVPELRLEGGYKGVSAGQGRSDGFLAGGALILPLWDRSAGLRVSAEGERRFAQGRRGLAMMELEGELVGLHTETMRLRRAALKFRVDAQSASNDLVRIANAGYAGGEMTVLELLDAYRGAVDDELTALDMELAARRTRIELDRVTGSEGP